MTQPEPGVALKPPVPQPQLMYRPFTGVRPMIEHYPLSRAAEAYDRMMSGKARFRVVLTPDK